MVLRLKRDSSTERKMNLFATNAIRMTRISVLFVRSILNLSAVRVVSTMP